MTCAEMWRWEKWTARRGRSGVPATFLRRRRWRDWRLFADADMVLLDGFAFLAADLFSGVADSLAFVGFRRVKGADICRSLADEMLVNAFDRDLCAFRDRDFHVRGDLEKDRMRFAEAEVKLLTLDCRFEADALDLELFLEALVDASDHIGDERAGKAVKGLDLAAFAVPVEGNSAALHAGADGFRKGPGELAFRPFDGERRLPRPRSL